MNERAELVKNTVEMIHRRNYRELLRFSENGIMQIPSIDVYRINKEDRYRYWAQCSWNSLCLSSPLLYSTEQCENWMVDMLRHLFKIQEITNYFENLSEERLDAVLDAQQRWIDNNLSCLGLYRTDVLLFNFETMKKLVVVCRRGSGKQ